VQGVGLGAGNNWGQERIHPWLGGLSRWNLLFLVFSFLSPQMMTALTASPLTKWLECIAIWTLYISNGVKAESPPPFPSHQWSLGRPTSPSLFIGCLLLVELYLTGERDACWGWAGIILYEGENVKLGNPIWTMNVCTTAQGCFLRSTLCSVPYPSSWTSPLSHSTESSSRGLKRLANVTRMTWQKGEGTSHLSWSAVPLQWGLSRGLLLVQWCLGEGKKGMFLQVVLGVGGDMQTATGVFQWLDWLVDNSTFHCTLWLPSHALLPLSYRIVIICAFSYPPHPAGNS
jgi:hypothetical protein